MSLDPNPDPESLRQHFLDAQRQHRDGRFEQAEKTYRELLAHDPKDHEVLRLLGVIKYQAGEKDEAADFFRRAVAAGSTGGQALEALGCVLAETGRREEAIRCLAQVVAANPQQQTAFFNLGMLLMDQEGRLDEAVRALERAVSLDLSSHQARGALARALLCSGEPMQALAQLDRVLADVPGDVYALAHKIAALAQLGHSPAIEALVDLETMIHIDRFEGEGGYRSVDELNEQLAEHILSHPTLGDERTTSNGMDTGEILDSEDPAVLALIDVIKKAVNRMVAGLDLESNHPFMRGRPDRWYLTGWGVRMWRGGFQIPHYHRDAWISGVYYVRLPNVISPADDSNQGWIEFGRGPDDIFQRSSPPTRRIHPQEGKLIAFPSYFWHRTLPFQDDQERLCISFNLVSADD